MKRRPREVTNSLGRCATSPQQLRRTVLASTKRTLFASTKLTVLASTNTLQPVSCAISGSGKSALRQTMLR